MSKVFLAVQLKVVVDTDLTGVDDIVNNLDFKVTPDSENVDVCDAEILNFHAYGTK